MPKQREKKQRRRAPESAPVAAARVTSPANRRAVLLRHVAIAAALVIAVVVAYAPAFRGPFIFDDELSIQRNVTIRQLWPPGRALHPPGSSLAVSGRPVVNYSLAVNYAINRVLGVDQRGDPYGPNKTVGYHILNVLLHLACGLLLFALVRRSVRDGSFTADWKSFADPLAAIVAALWLLHPIQTEAINYVVQRTEVLVSAFYLATLYAAVRAWDATSRRAAVGWRCAAIVACALGMGSKEVMITAPLMVILYDRAFRFKSWRELLRFSDDRRWFYPLLAATSLWAVFLIAGAPRGGTVGFDLGLRWYEYLYSQAWAILHYLRLFIWPDRLTLDYGSHPVHGLGGVPGLLLLSAFGVATIVAWTRANQWGWFAFLGTFFFFLLAPSSSFVPIATEIAAERRIYLALAAVIVLVVVGAEWLRRRIVDSSHAPTGRGTRAGVYVVAAVCLALVVSTYRRSEAYATPEVLWRQVVERVPSNPRGYNDLAQSLLKQKPPRTAEAVPLLHQALALDSTSLAALRSLAAIDVSLGRLEQAKTLLQREVAINPSYLDGAVRLGMVLVALGESQRAIPYLANPPVDLLAEDDPSGKGLIALGTTLSALGQWSNAAAVYRRSLELAPHQTSVEEFLGDALLHENRADEAIAPLEDAAQRAPTAFGLALLSRAYADVGRVDEAIRMASAVMKAGADDPLVYDLAGQAMLAAHRPTDAALLFRRALALDPNDEQARRGMAAITAAKSP